MDAYAAWLGQVKGIGRKTVYKLRQAMEGRFDAGSQGERGFAGTLYQMPEEELLLLLGTALERGGDPGRVLESIQEARKIDPMQLAGEYEKQGIHLLTPEDTAFPQRMREIPDPPYFLYSIGRLPRANVPSCAIVGARMATAYGRSEARDFALELARNGVQIISGMASGIDGIAGRAALEVSDESYAVLGCGVDVCYPVQNQDLYNELIKRGGVISEYAPGTEPEARLFPMRNRIISGLSDVVLVIEAKEKSGTLITTDMALQQGRDIFAVPGRITDRTSRGCNELIRQGAFPATSPDDVLEYLFSDTAKEIRQKNRTQLPFRQEDLEELAKRMKAREERENKEEELRRQSVSNLGAVERAIYESLDPSTPNCLDDLLPVVRRHVGYRVSFSELMRGMTALYLKKMAKEVRVGYYIRT